MQGTRRNSVNMGFGVDAAPWIVAGALLFGASAPATAQDATPPPVEIGTEGTLPTTDAPAADPAAAPAADAPAADESGSGRGGRGGRDDADVAAVPAVGVGPGALGGGSSLIAIGAAVSAAAAGAAALRGRFGIR